MATKKYQYRDLDLNFLIHPITKDLVLKTDVNAIIASVKNIILATSGEFLWEPYMGGGASSLLFELNLPLLKIKMHDQIVNNLTQFEPRIEISSLVINDMNNGNGIEIVLTFYALNNSTPVTTTIPLMRTR